MDEKQLVEKLSSGDQYAFRYLVNKYQKPIRNLCLGMVIEPDVADELSQDVFIEVFRSIKSFRSDSKLSTWMYRMAVNKSLNYIRSQKKHRILLRFESFILNEENSIQYQIEDKKEKNALDTMIYYEEEVRVQKALSILPDNQRIAFTLHKFDELSYKEITEILNLSLSSVESLIHRAKKNLQKSLISANQS